MALHTAFPRSPYEPLLPDQRWFPADEALRETAYEKLLPPLVAKIRREVQAWRDAGYAGASATSIALLRYVSKYDLATAYDLLEPICVKRASGRDSRKLGIVRT
jgi:hypothetical protein